MSRLSHSILLLALVTTGCTEGPGGDQGPIGDQGPQGDQGDPGDPGDPGGEGDTSWIISADATWDTDTTVASPVFVEEGATLTISPGVTVDFLPGGAMWVSGAVVIAGAVGSLVTLSSTTTFDGTVSGLHIADTTSGSSIAYATLDGVSVDVIGTGIDALTAVDFIDAGLRMSDNSSGLTLTDCTFTATGEYEGTWMWLDDVAIVTLIDSEFNGGEDALTILADDAVVSLTNTRFANALDGVEIIGTNSTITASSLVVQGSGDENDTGVVLEADTVTVTDSTFADMPGRGGVNGRQSVTVTNSSFTDVGNAVTGKDPVVADVTVLRCGAAIDSGGTADIDRVTVQQCYRGIDVYSGDVSQVLVEDCESNGIDLGMDGTLSASDIRDNGGYGIRGATWSEWVITGNNIHGNGSWAAWQVGSVEGNYIADNNSESGVDTTAAGTVDTVKDVSSAQISSVDAVSNPQSSAVASTGP